MARTQIHWLRPTDPPDAFPDINDALSEPNGLLAAGGDLSPERLLTAYPRGIFPWYDEGQPILWWSPAPRCVLRPEALRLSRRMRQYCRRSPAQLMFNQAFGDVVDACADERPSQAGTWITPEMQAAYTQLHELGWAHSVEVWQHDALVGGMYGLAIGRVFFGESMFSRIDNASKFAMAGLCQTLINAGFTLIDCQVPSQHLISLGAEHISREAFGDWLERDCTPPTPFDQWPKKPLPVAKLMENL